MLWRKHPIYFLNQPCGFIHFKFCHRYVLMHKNIFHCDILPPFTFVVLLFVVTISVMRKGVNKPMIYRQLFILV